MDRHYGHLARDGHNHAIRLLDTYAADVHRVDAGWTPRPLALAGSENGNAT